MNEVDLGIVPQRSVPAELSFHLITTHPAYLLTSKGHPLARRARSDFESLLNEETIKQYPLIVAEVQIEGYTLEDTFTRLGLSLNVGMEVGSVNTLKQYVARNLGVAVIPGLCVTEADRSSLEVVPVPKDLGGDSTYGVVLRKDQHRSRLLTDLLMRLGVSVGNRS